MDNMERVHQDLSDIKVSMERIRVTLEHNTANLGEHMRRTEIGEHRLEKLENVNSFGRWAIVSLIGIISVAATVKGLLGL